MKGLNQDKMNSFLNSGKTPIHFYCNPSGKVHIVLTQGFAWVKSAGFHPASLSSQIPEGGINAKQFLMINSYSRLTSSIPIIKEL